MSPLRIARVVAEKLLPRPVVLLLWFTYGLLRRPVKSYAQKGEDLIIKGYFDALGIREGFYLDIGCFHPVWISNTHVLDRAGWHGAAVDIDEFKLRGMKAWRWDRVQCILGAVCGQAAEHSTATVYKFRGGGWSDIDTMDRATAEAYRAKGAGPFVEATVERLDINRLLAGLPHVHCINIDIEGVDREVLLALDFARFRPELICFEDNDHWGGHESVRGRLEQVGYERLFISGGSIGYALPPKPPAPGAAT